MNKFFWGAIAITVLLVLEGWLWVLFVPDFAVLILTREYADTFMLFRHFIFDLPFRMLFMLVSWLLAYVIVLEVTSVELEKDVLCHE